MPSELPLGLVIAAVPERADPRDAVVSRNGEPLEALPAGARVGTGSPRRAAQLLALRPDLRPEDIRGNVDTRLRRLDQGAYDAIIVAAAGLSRLGFQARAAELLDPEVLTPAAGQGALAIEARGSDDFALEVLRALDHAPTRVCVEAERAFLRRLGAGCRFPVGALATLEDGVLRITGAIAERPGAPVIRGELRGGPDERERLGTSLAEELASRAGLPLAEVGA
jgi:hydroxymethylbilane synthase